MLMTRITMMEVMMMRKMVVLVIMMMPLTSHFLQDFLASILEDEQLHTLLNLYDQISTNSYRPFRFQTLQLQALLMILNFSSRFPPSDACERLKEGLSALNYLEVSSLFIIIITNTIIITRPKPAYQPAWDH